MKHFLSFALAALVAFGSVRAETTGKTVDDDLQRYHPAPYVQVQHPDWTKNAVLYQVNLRQFTPEGTLAAAEKQLPRIKALGADIVWLMPIHPIGQKNRKGRSRQPVFGARLPGASTRNSARSTT